MATRLDITIVRRQVNMVRNPGIQPKVKQGTIGQLTETFRMVKAGELDLQGDDRLQLKQILGELGEVAELKPVAEEALASLSPPEPDLAGAAAAQVDQSSVGRSVEELCEAAGVEPGPIALQQPAPAGTPAAQPEPTSAEEAPPSEEPVRLSAADIVGADFHFSEEISQGLSTAAKMLGGVTKKFNAFAAEYAAASGRLTTLNEVVYGRVIPKLTEVRAELRRLEAEIEGAKVAKRKELERERPIKDLKQRAAENQEIQTLIAEIKSLGEQWKIITDPETKNSLSNRIEEKKARGRQIQEELKVAYEAEDSARTSAIEQALQAFETELRNDPRYTQPQQELSLYESQAIEYRGKRGAAIIELREAKEKRDAATGEIGAFIAACQAGLEESNRVLNVLIEAAQRLIESTPAKAEAPAAVPAAPQVEAEISHLGVSARGADPALRGEAVRAILDLAKQGKDEAIVLLGELDGEGITEAQKANLELLGSQSSQG